MVGITMPILLLCARHVADALNDLAWNVRRGRLGGRCVTGSPRGTEHPGSAQLGFYRMWIVNVRDADSPLAWRVHVEAATVMRKR